jgi:hypothetical protein
MSFVDLPLDILQTILEKLHNPVQLSRASRVSKAFWEYATPLLYERISIFPWHKHGKQNVRVVTGILGGAVRGQKEEHNV